MLFYEFFAVSELKGTSSQVGAWLSSYAWYRFADIKNSKLFLELWWEVRGAWLSSAHCLVPPTSKTINRFWEKEPHPKSAHGFRLMRGIVSPT
ncbi:MAG: hypothetical protein IKK06_05995, partial [Clostridia bacterium]|nr:hypothetical protein [Clostridia bacterium]